MTNLDQHSALFGTSFGVMGNLGGFIKNTPVIDGVFLSDGVSARRIRRRNRQHRQH